MIIKIRNRLFIAVSDFCFRMIFSVFPVFVISHEQITACLCRKCRQSFYTCILSIRAKMTSFWSLFSLAQRSSSSFWSSVRETGVSPSDNNWESVIPKAWQIFFKEGMVGTIFFRYHEEIVDCGSPERSASWYSVQPLFCLYVVMVVRISFKIDHPFAFVLRKLYFDKSLFFDNLYRIIITINATRQGGCIYAEKKENRNFVLLNRDFCINSRGYDIHGTQIEKVHWKKTFKK